MVFYLYKWTALRKGAALHAKKAEEYPGTVAGSSGEGGVTDSKRRIETTRFTLIQEIKVIKKNQSAKFLPHKVKF